MPLIRQESCTNTLGRDGTVLVLETGDALLKVWPALGFNAFHWSATGHDLLHADPNFFHELRPSRTGWPILFPFPNRIREGQYTWRAKEYHLPLNDNAGKNAIHGFAHVSSWRIADQGTEGDAVWLTGEFQADRDAPQSAPLWPANYRLQITYRLEPGTLTVRAELANPGPGLLPWGLGYHPYFRVEPFGGPDALVSVPAAQLWVLDENLPTGERVPVDARRDLRKPRPFAELQLDDAYTDLSEAFGPWTLAGTIAHPDGSRRLRLFRSPEFREMVLFTPPHRQAICIEPYTCTTDAIRLQAQGIDGGLAVLKAREAISANIQVRFETS